jgi:hypothetical protein
MRNRLKAFVDQTKGNTLSEISKLIFCALLLTLVLGSGPACSGFHWWWENGGTPTPTPGPEDVREARQVRFFNCNHDNAGTGLSGRDYNVYSRVEDGAWVGRGGLNHQPGDWADCENDPAHQGAALPALPADPLDLFATQPGKWEFRLIKLPLPGEPDCDSSAPDVSNACGYLSYFYQTVNEAQPVQEDVTGD